LELGDVRADLVRPVQLTNHALLLIFGDRRLISDQLVAKGGRNRRISAIEVDGPLMVEKVFIVGIGLASGWVIAVNAEGGQEYLRGHAIHLIRAPLQEGLCEGLTERGLEHPGIQLQKDECREEESRDERQGSAQDRSEAGAASVVEAHARA